ncbi:iron/manganese superoxide dismutase, alpha-hairpin domain-containing protein [Ditylenchus destructor]|nr:iron/manganese superoxide dismutase, alpha-hairpin domain-containing protein [Ditylenchus destructor]
MLLQKSAGIRRAMFSSSVISRRFKHVLPDLPYDYGALEPEISAEIMRLHHQKHHATYVNNLNVAEEKCHEALQKGDVRAAITLHGALKFNGGVHFNHSNLCKHGGNPSGSYPLFGVRNMCSGGNKDPGSVEVKIKLESYLEEKFKANLETLELKLKSHCDLVKLEIEKVKSETDIKIKFIYRLVLGVAGGFASKVLYDVLRTPKSGTKEVKVGDSFASQKSSKPGNVNEFHTLRYDFKPKSVAGEQETYVGMADNNDVQVVVPSENSLTAYKGSKKVLQGDKECVLVFDRDSGNEPKEDIAQSAKPDDDLSNIFT